MSGMNGFHAKKMEGETRQDAGFTKDFRMSLNRKYEIY